MEKLDSASVIANLTGNWKSRSVEDLGNNTFGIREFNFTQDRWKLKFTLYGDAAMNYPVFAFGASGAYKIEGLSEAVQGAYNVLFGFDTKTLTLLTSSEQIIQSLGFGGCSLQVGVQKDISLTGCSFLLSVADYSKEYDLVGLSEGILCLGLRPADNNMGTEDKRPRALGYPLARA